MNGSPIKYSDFFNSPVPENPISLILSIPKDELIASISAINTRLKPIYNIQFDNSVETQIDCLRAILLDLHNPINHGISTPFIKKYLKLPSDQILFTRVTCLYAFQEILACDDFVKSRPPQYTPEQRVNLFKYLLICNERILHFDQTYSEKDHKELGEEFFEYFMFKEIPHNQYYYVPNPLNRFYLGWYLMSLLSKDCLYGKHIESFLQETFGLENVQDFFKYVLSQFFQSNDDELKITYLKIKIEHSQVIEVLSKFSNRNNIPLPSPENLEIFDFLELKKSPVYDGGLKEGIHTFIIMDSILFLEKVYTLFINDFWFDYLKPNNICNRKDWGNFIGTKFFEPFIHEKFLSITTDNSKFNYMSSDLLTFNINGKGSIEYADYYLRKKNKVLLVEAKSNYLPMINGYKTVDTIDDFKKIDKDKFYKDFGINQLVEKTIKEFNLYKGFIKDPPLKNKGKVKIYPLLLLNESIISFGPSNLAFRKRFEKLLKANNIDEESETIRIMPLSILNISELQDIEQALIDRDNDLFNLFQTHFSATDPKKIKSIYEAATPLNFLINKHFPNHKRINNVLRRFKWLGF